MNGDVFTLLRRFIIGALGAACMASCKLSDPYPVNELNTIRGLSASGDFVELTDLLDRSMVIIPAGEFILGSRSGHPDEQPEREIYLDAYQIDRYEVTNAQYQRFVLAEEARPPQHWIGGSFPDGQADWPVTGVSWQEASSYCQWKGKRLPSKAEWEKACRGPDANTYPWGNEWDSKQANTGIELASKWPPTVEALWNLLETEKVDDLRPQPQPVGSYPQGSSAYGVMDMVGNASEWVLDWYTWQGYQDLPERNPVGSSPPWNHSVRGSGWVDKDGEQYVVEDLSRCSRRNSSHTSNDPRLGLRCARSTP
jgi:sulfatase modifying factor 1